MSDRKYHPTKELSDLWSANAKGAVTRASVADIHRWLSHGSLPLIVFVQVLLILLIAPPSICKTRGAITFGWKQPVDQPICLAMSTGCQYYGVVEKDGTVRLYSANGRLMWKQEVDGATNMLIAKNCQSVLVYSKLNPSHQYISFYTKEGRRLWRHEVEGSVWAGAISPDGTLVAITTSEQYVYVYKPDPKRPSYRRWRLDGIGYQVTFSGDSNRVIIGTSDESALVCYDIYGRFQWRYRHSRDVRYHLCISGDGRRILGILAGTADDPEMEFCLWDSGGKRLWKRSMSAFDGRAVLSPQSRYVAVSYACYLGDGESQAVERRVAVYSSVGRLLWEKGGLFFAPHLIALSPKGSSVIVSDGEKSLYNIDSRGKLLSKYTLPATLRETVASEDGRAILIYCGNGWLYLVRASEA